MNVCKIFAAIFVVSALAVPVYAAVQNVATHIDKQNNPQGCSTCHFRFNHKTMGPDLCMICHGNQSRRTERIAARMPAGTVVPNLANLKDLESEFRKTYRHPSFDVRGVHVGNETLPEVDPKAARHADCVDCHNTHYLSPANKYAGFRGKRTGNILGDITREYDLCYRCHAESSNLPGRSTNKRSEFSLNNPSFHPVEGEGKNGAVVSLIKPYKEKKVYPGDVSVITCGDCHGSDSATAPAGPHGSNFQHILVENYSTKDNQPESSYAYSLCYRCHNRSSILGNESFRYHAIHIQGSGGVANPNGTSCYTCHNSHGSLDSKYLIKFNPEVVSPNSRGILKFTEKGVSTFRGECFLSCHGVDHDPKSY